MKVLCIDHIGVAVKEISKAGSFYTDILGLKIEGIETVDDQKVKVAFIPVTDTEVELLESTRPDGPVAKYIESRGEGIQHIAFRVENLEAALSELKEKGVRLIDEKPRQGAGGAKIAFIHPGETRGVLVELCEREKS
ncbi:MAG: methylmalonyl-CoA epimerase [Deltaproteobacteria bacterium]|nr:methylmalonyl-CoA epimerase [Deltaproteobacteria bacterium]MBW2018151.1 methylmalonyl-CoA epimerase [Deltaproteobacteria bacterium]MBW2128768.1 methylmalonyl-CoA epimerase [Deltaproteobacteria bacterium]MBW2303807.1 methylmalonyl-CoA epimerase [Deltaproteobacteria bacterium]